MVITRAERDDLGRILGLQYAAYRSEAELLNNYEIQPLKQTLSELEREFAEGIILKAVHEDGHIVGSVRGREEGRTLLVGKLIVDPAYQGRGIGTELLEALEKACPRARYELFTSSLSARNLSLYEKLGYVRFREREVSPGLTLVFLEKCRDAV